MLNYILHDRFTMTAYMSEFIFFLLNFNNEILFKITILRIFGAQNFNCRKKKTPFFFFVNHIKKILSHDAA